MLANTLRRKWAVPDADTEKRDFSQALDLVRQLVIERFDQHGVWRLAPFAKSELYSVDCQALTAAGGFGFPVDDRLPLNE